MLVLSRDDGGEILIYPSEGVSDALTAKELFQAGPIRIVVNIEGKRARVSVQAPDALTIIRGELAAGD
jgi:sRNA-binding carbon storage regulator CsrA